VLQYTLCPFVGAQGRRQEMKWGGGAFCKNVENAGVKVGRHYAVLAFQPADAISDSESEIVKFTISIPRESCTNAKAKYSSSVVPPNPSVHFYHWENGGCFL